jgi:hypothetical protein
MSIRKTRGTFIFLHCCCAYSILFSDGIHGHPTNSGRFLENKRNCRRTIAHAKCVHTNFRTRVVDYHRFAGAFLFGQMIDVYVFHYLKMKTGEKSLWLRATGSTLVSQFIDSFVVLFIAFYIGADWSLSLVLAIGVVNYIYKFTVACCSHPCFTYCTKPLMPIWAKNLLNK